MLLCALGMPWKRALTAWRERVYRAGPPEPQDPNARRIQPGTTTTAEDPRLGGESSPGGRTDPLIRSARQPSYQDRFRRERPSGGSAGFVKTGTAHARTRASKTGVAPVRLGNSRAGVLGPTRQAQTEENTEDRWKRPCEFWKCLFVNRSPMSFSHPSAGMRRRTLIGTGPLRAAPQTHEPVENPDSTLKDCLLDPGNFLAGLGN